jgi:LemA protein
MKWEVMMLRKVSPLLILISVVVIVLALAGLFGSYIRYHNAFVSLEERIDGAWAEVENNLQRRADLIPNLVATVKGYARHEEEVFTEIANARSKLLGAGGINEKAAAASEFESALGRLLVVVEKYPELKADQRFAELQDELAGTENRLAVARMRYNESVQVFNARIRSFPGSMIAGMMGLEKRNYFEAASGTEKVPEVLF